jgi:hypothetical protein
MQRLTVLVAVHIKGRVKHGSYVVTFNQSKLHCYDVIGGPPDDE